METIKNAQPIQIEEFFERVRKRVYQMKYYYSLYITPSGEIIDCGYPACLGHSKFSVEVYENLESLPKEIYSSCLRGLNIPYNEIPYYIKDYHNLLDVMYVDVDLDWTINKVLLGTENIICQDLGFVKVAINTATKHFEVEPPCSVFGKCVTNAQKETISKLAQRFEFDLTGKLKSELRNNASLACKIQTALNQGAKI